MQRELSTFPLAPHHLHKLTNAGYLTVEDLKDVTPTELSQDMETSKEDALQILLSVRNKSFPTEKPGSNQRSSVGSGISNLQTISAYDLLQQEQALGCIVTFCEQLDDMLGGGVPMGKITEFCGAPGVGKTQIGMQLAVDVQIPQEFGGLGGEAIYIDTEGSFIVDRVVDIAEAAIKHLKHVAQSCDKMDADYSSQARAVELFQLEKILSRIKIFRCHDYLQLIAISHLLPDLLKENPKIKLIVVDSIAFHFRHDFEDLALRTRLLNGLAQSFIRMACESQLAVVLMNQMTTRVRKDQLGQSHLIPALGESWGHASTIRVILFWDDNKRFATLYKSPTRQETTVPFQIVTSGVRDVVKSNSSTEGHCSGITESETCRAGTNIVPENTNVLRESKPSLGGRKRPFEEVS